MEPTMPHIQRTVISADVNYDTKVFQLFLLLASSWRMALVAISTRTGLGKELLKFDSLHSQ